MAAFSQTTLSNASTWMKILEFRLKFHWSLFLRVLSTIFQHWFWKWPGADQATSHYLNQWCLVYWRKYASFGLNELSHNSPDHLFCLKKLILVSSTIYSIVNEYLNLAENRSWGLKYYSKCCVTYSVTFHFIDSINPFKVFAALGWTHTLYQQFQFRIICRCTRRHKDGRRLCGSQ